MEHPLRRRRHHGCAAHTPAGDGILHQRAPGLVSPSRGCFDVVRFPVCNAGERAIRRRSQHSTAGYPRRHHGTFRRTVVAYMDARRGHHDRRCCRPRPRFIRTAQPVHPRSQDGYRQCADQPRSDGRGRGAEVSSALPAARGDLPLRIFRAARDAARRLLLLQPGSAGGARAHAGRVRRRPSWWRRSSYSRVQTSWSCRMRRSSAPTRNATCSASRSMHRSTTIGKSASSNAAIAAKPSKCGNGSGSAGARSRRSFMKTSSSW